MNSEYYDAPAGAALLVIYGHYLTINRRAMDILGITRDAPYIRFSTTSSGHISVTGTVSPSGHRVHIRSHCGRISSTSLARWLGHSLQGQGTYRIQEEYCVPNPTGESRHCYEIFFRKYPNKRDYATKTETDNPAAAHAAEKPETSET